MVFKPQRVSHSVEDEETTTSTTTATTNLIYFGEDDEEEEEVGEGEMPPAMSQQPRQLACCVRVLVYRRAPNAELGGGFPSCVIAGRLRAARRGARVVARPAGSAADSRVIIRTSAPAFGEVMGEDRWAAWRV